jgi:hypothetical protein
VETTPKPAIRVAGDSTIDWRVALPDASATAELQTAYQWEARDAPGVSSESGGASLLARLLTRAASAAGVTVAGPTIPGGALTDPNDPRWPRTFGSWRPFPAVLGQPRPAWRLDRFWGVRPAADSAPESDDPLAPELAPCLVLDDADFAFRSCPERWPAELGAATTRHVLHKIAGSLAPSDLWSQSLVTHADRLTSYVAVGDLRKEYAAIGQPHSWQRTAEEVVTAVQGHPALGLAQRVVVSLGLAGAVFLERGADPLLVFDPLHQEGDWERGRPGTTLGVGTCLVAALALAAAARPEAPAWADGLRRGLTAARAIHEHGFDVDEARGAIAFPIARAAEALLERLESPAAFASAAIRLGHEWLMPAVDASQLRRLARRIVVEGDAAPRLGVPVERMGAWVSVDRTEIEDVRSVRLIANQYLTQRRRPRPLNLAVFGPPGSGKSFAVKQMATEWAAGGDRLEILEFNIAEFAGPGDLAVAFQRVRDAAVEQALPLVFWDEFDSSHEGRELGWLARFLAPMQDGAFLEGGMARPIGPAIFVFAGGTHPTLASFKERAVTVPGAKATDFLSRLRGHIDVLGPNPRDDEDRAFVLRRALLLRAQLLARAPQVTPDGRPNLDPGVLRAFLEAPAYLHGARSLEAIVEMSGLSGRLRFERSALPAAHQLALHVDPQAFLDLVNQEPPAP